MGPRVAASRMRRGTQEEREEGRHARRPSPMQEARNTSHPPAPPSRGCLQQATVRIVIAVPLRSLSRPHTIHYRHSTTPSPPRCARPSRILKPQDGRIRSRYQALADDHDSCNRGWLCHEGTGSPSPLYLPCIRPRPPLPPSGYRLCMSSSDYDTIPWLMQATTGDEVAIVCHPVPIPLLRLCRAERPLPHTFDVNHGRRQPPSTNSTHFFIVRQLHAPPPRIRGAYDPQMTSTWVAPLRLSSSVRTKSSAQLAAFFTPCFPHAEQPVANTTIANALQTRLSMLSQPSLSTRPVRYRSD